MMWLVSVALADDSMLWRSDLGASLGLVAVRSSTGNHRVDPALGLWARKGFGSGFAELELGMATNADLVPGGKLRRNLYRSAVLVGWRGGSRPMHVSLAGGVAGSTIIGNGVMAFQPGVRLRGDLRVPVGKRSVFVWQSGMTTRGRGADVDVGIGWGLRW
ncbi:MAG TPA: hypothetical protein QGF58_14805 [Myxococcota bacterium]|nr:hypothetical protein [Myxococcota bacterium]